MRGWQRHGQRGQRHGQRGRGNARGTGEKVRALGEWQGGWAPSGLFAGGTACLSDERRGGGGACLSRRSEQAADDAVFVHVNIFGGGMAGQAGHGVDFSREGDDKAGSGGEADFSYRERIAARGTEQRFVV